MKPALESTPARRVLDAADLGSLIGALRDRGYRVVGPTVRDGAIVYGEIASPSDLPAGWTDEQDGGHYRLRRRQDEALFGYAVGPHSWKRFLFPPQTLLFRARRTEDGFEVQDEPEETPRYAFLGVRACELAAIAVQDRVFAGDGYHDPTYASRRERAFLVAVNCSTPAGTCFCVSMGTGPRATDGFDLAFTEVLGESHFFVVEAGTDRGLEVLDDLPDREAGHEEETEADAVVAAAAERMGREMDTTGIRDLLARNYEHPRWDDVAERCLTCGNCTLACPTCFCSTVDDATALPGDVAERRRRWDSCFTLDFSFLSGGSVRTSARGRYRQWMTHKLGTWWDQFGTSGCVGCGRCITWCPVGIDITEEVRAIRQSEGG